MVASRRSTRASSMASLIVAPTSVRVNKPASASAFGSVSLLTAQGQAGQVPPTKSSPMLTASGSAHQPLCEMLITTESAGSRSWSCQDRYASSGTDTALKEVVYTRAKGTPRRTYMNGERTRRRPISLAELASVPHRMRATLAVDLGQWQREVTARAQLPAELLSVQVQAYVVRPPVS